MALDNATPRSGERFQIFLALDNLASVYQEMHQPGRAAVYWQEAAAAMREVGELEEAARLEQQAANALTAQRS